MGVYVCGERKRGSETDNHNLIYLACRLVDIILNAFYVLSC